MINLINCILHDRSFTLALNCVRAIILQLRRERIAERMMSLQELVPNANKVISSSFVRVAVAALTQRALSSSRTPAKKLALVPLFPDATRACDGVFARLRDSGREWAGR
jgi:hypothetical protein